MRKAAGYIAYALAALLVVAGCSGTSGGVDGPVIQGNDRDGGNDGGLSGTVVIEGDCIYLQGPVERFPIVWPYGTSWRSEEEAIELPDATLVFEGDHISGGGGWRKGGALDEYTLADGAELAARCVDNQYGEVVVFNPYPYDHIEIEP